MRVFGNLMNRIAESSAQVAPVVGMGATITMFSDRHPATIVEVRTARMIIIQEDSAERIDSNGMSESQEYKFTPDAKAPLCIYTQRKDGSWKERGGSNGLIIGHRGKYHDFGF